MARYYRHQGLAPTDLVSAPCAVCGGTVSRFIADDNGFAIRKCSDETCGFVFVDPRPSAERLAKFYEQFYDPGDAVPERWQREMGAIFEECCRFLSARSSSGAVLDIGCSFGHLLAEMEARGWEVTGIEPSPVAAEYAQKTISGTVHAAPFENVQLAPSSFDAVVSLYVLEHVSAPRQFVERVADLLRPGGVAIIRIPYTAPLFPLQRLLRRSLMYAPMHLNDFSPEAMRRLALSAGFARVETRVGQRRRAHDPTENLGALLFGGMGRVVEVASRGRVVFPWVGALTYYLYK